MFSSDKTQMIYDNINENENNNQKNGPLCEKTYIQGVTNNTGTDQSVRIDQPVHPRILISAFVISFLKIIISKLAIGKMSIF